MTTTELNNAPAHIISRGNEAHLFATPNTEKNHLHSFSEKEYRLSFENNEEAISYLKNKTFKSSPIWEQYNNCFVAITQNWYYVIYFKL